MIREDAIEVSVVMPCLNEEGTIVACIDKAAEVFRRKNISGEIIVSDNGSTDRSVQIAEKHGARVVHQKERGYGRAYQLGIAEAKGRIIVIGDSDNTYDFSMIMKFIEPLRNGYEFVNGSRIRGRIHKGAMPFLHRYLGNPVLSAILNIFFRSGFSDVYCGMKAFTKEVYKKIKPVSPGMEFALELIINACRLNLKRTEVSVELHPRKGESKLRTFRDGWRSLRFMLLYCPNYLFLVPGGMIFIIGFIGMAMLLKGPVFLFGHTFDFHAMIFFSMSTILGFLLINFGFFAKTYALAEGFEGENIFFRRFYRYFNLEKGIVIGVALVVIALLILFTILREWIFLGPVLRERQELFAETLLVIGMQVIFSSFLISLIGMKAQRRNE